jgi:hypothetical protein
VTVVVAGSPLIMSSAAVPISVSMPLVPWMMLIAPNLSPSVRRIQSTVDRQQEAVPIP